MVKINIFPEIMCFLAVPLSSLLVSRGFEGLMSVSVENLCSPPEFVTPTGVCLRPFLLLRSWGSHSGCHLRSSCLPLISMLRPPGQEASMALFPMFVGVCWDLQGTGRELMQGGCLLAHHFFFPLNKDAVLFCFKVFSCFLLSRAFLV